MKRVTGCVAWLFMVMTFSAHAFLMGGTRVVLKAKEGVASIAVISGPQDGVSLVKARVLQDRNKGNIAPEFIVSPPVSRLEKGGRNNLRIQLLRSDGLAGDRESVFYLDIAAIPATNPLDSNQSGSSASVIIGTGANVKLFYRPSALSDPTPDTWSALQFRRMPGGVEVSNPTPYYVSFASLRSGGMLLRTYGVLMIAPFGKQIYGLPSGASKQVEWSVFDDLGSRVSGSTPIL
ncbi:fimbrial biogenesis chaperone [Citrobacter koseri]|uniref:fimbrial biogenesis chaperone n=1 Tax=Citrobacter koseri TaxID=545 RepID=UPI001F38E07B|nr:molecular chaperone [Citrobacter koseri]